VGFCVAAPIDINNPPQKRAAILSFLSTLILTLASPKTIILFLSLFSTYGVFDVRLSNADIFHLVMGVMMGAMSWWIILTSFVNFVHTRTIWLFSSISTVFQALALWGLGRIPLVTPCTIF